MAWKNYNRGGYSRGEMAAADYGYKWPVRSGYGRGSSGGYSRGSYGGYGRRKRSSWPKGKKNSNAWGRVIDHDGQQVFIGGAWLYDFKRRALFKIDITPKYSRKTGDGDYEKVDPSYENSQGRLRFKVKCEVTNVDTFQKMYGTSVFNPDTGKIYFENLDLMVNINKKTACFNPFSKEFRPNRRVNYKK